MLPETDLDARCIVAVNLVMAYWTSGKLNAADQAIREVLETGRATGNLYTIAMAQIHQGMILVVRGKLHEAYERIQNFIQQGAQPAFLLCAAYFYLSVVQYEWNQLEQSGKALLEAMKIAKRIRNDEMIVSSWLMMARLHQASGNLPAAQEAVEQAHRKAVEGEFIASSTPRLAVARVQLALFTRDLQAADEWSEKMAAGADWNPFFRYTNTTQALYLLAKGQPERASHYLEECFERATLEGWGNSKIAIRTLQALAGGETEQGIAYLREALQWAQSEGYLRTFLDVGERLEPLLRAAIRRRIVPDYAEDILRAMTDRSQKPIIGQLSLIEPINPRELEVLSLMTLGMSNNQIAEKLVISTGTVKTHVHNICGKLGARNRTAAAQRARELGLV